MGLTRAMALALAPHRIRVNAIAPGLRIPRSRGTATRRRSWSRWAARSRWEAGWPRPEEIARVAVFLAAEDSGWITGQTIHVNGGAFMGG